MNPEKKDLFQLSWSQSYSMQPLQDSMDELFEVMIEASEYTEAKEVLAEIMYKK